jgi:hypothetical protein
LWSLDFGNETPLTVLELEVEVRRGPSGRFGDGGRLVPLEARPKVRYLTHLSELPRFQEDCSVDGGGGLEA